MNRRGFTIIEMTIVLVIIGLLLGSGASMFTMLTKRVKSSETRAALKNAKDSLVSFAAANGRLPESDAEFTAAIGDPNDPFSRTWRYRIADNLDNTSITDIVCRANTTPLSVRLCEEDDCSGTVTDINNMAFFILSGGENRNIQTDFSADPIVFWVNKVTVDNYTSAAAPTDPDREETFDDYAVWASLAELKAQIDCTGSQLTVLNNELPYAPSSGRNYQAALYADGGLPDGANYRWCIQTDNASLFSASTFSTTGYVSTDCPASAPASWTDAASVSITGDNSTSVGHTTYLLNVYVRDSDNTTVSKRLLITVGP